MDRFRPAWTCWLAMAAAGLSGANPVQGAMPSANAVSCVDVALASNDSLQGQVVSSQGATHGRVVVVLVQAGREVARTTTDDSGNFLFGNLRGGHYTLAAGNNTTNVRAWAAGTAPPAAQPSLLVVDQLGLARGQDAGGFWRTVSNPWVTAGLITTAVAVPIALGNNDSGS